MKIKEIEDMALAYTKKHGFKPGAIRVAPENRRELLDALNREKGIIGADITEEEIKGEIPPIMGMPIVKGKPGTGIEVIRQTGEFQRIKLQNASDIYMPIADITNAMQTILRATLSFLPACDSADDPKIKTSKGLAQFLNDAKTKGVKWEEHALPALQDMLKGITGEDKELLLTKFFFCVLDYYWHACRLTVGDPEEAKKQCIQSIELSSLLRTMPKEMRAEYTEHLAAYGMYPELMDNKEARHA